MPDQAYPGLLRRLVDDARFPALAQALRAGVFDDASSDPLARFHTGLAQLVDGVEVKVLAAADRN
jgi:hypothetical protein